ncbi:hypothetical protein RI367_002482 [Sorochytrium milnesiophthora]
MGSGVTIAIHNKLASHVQQVWRVPGYAVAVRLAFRGASIRVVCLYVCPGDRRGVVEPALQEFIRQHYSQAGELGDMCVVAGDFNAAAEPHHDRLSQHPADTASEGILHSTLTTLGAVDLWRQVHSRAHHEGWTFRNSSRIDYIYGCPQTSQRVTTASTTTVMPAVSTDHQAVIVRLALVDLMDGHIRHAQRNALQAATRRVLDIKNTSKEQWDAYKLAMERWATESATAAALDRMVSWVRYTRCCLACAEREQPEDAQYLPECQDCAQQMRSAEIAATQEDIEGWWNDIALVLRNTAMQWLSWRTLRDVSLRPANTTPLLRATRTVGKVYRRLKKRRVTPKAAWQQACAAVPSDYTHFTDNAPVDDQHVNASVRRLL